MASEPVVTTLPISLRENPNFETFFSPVIANAIAHLVGGVVEFPVNLYGIKHGGMVEDSAGSLAYSNQLQCFFDESPLSLITSDINPNYKEFVSKKISQLKRAGVLQVQEIDLLLCKCGRSQFPVEALESIQNSPHLIERTSQGFVCKFCKEGLVTESHEVLILPPQMKLPALEILPARYNKKVLNQLQTLSSRSIILSRVNRSGSKENVVEDFEIDADVWWACLPFFKHDHETSVIVVTSSSTLWHAMRSFYIASSFCHLSSITFFIHPYIQIVDGVIDLKKMSLAEFALKAESVKAARLFPILGLQWSSDKSQLSSSELYLVNHSYKAESQSYPKSVVSALQVCRVLQRSTMISFLKKQRSFADVSLSDDEQKLAAAMLGQW